MIDFADVLVVFGLDGQGLLLQGLAVFALCEGLVVLGDALALETLETLA